MDDDFEAEATFEEAEQRRARHGGNRDMSPERKAARVRAREAAERAAGEVRTHGVTVLPGGTFVLAENVGVARAAGLTIPPWYARLWAWVKGMFA